MGKERDWISNWIDDFYENLEFFLTKTDKFGSL